MNAHASHWISCSADDLMLRCLTSLIPPCWMLGPVHGSKQNKHVLKEKKMQLQREYWKLSPTVRAKWKLCRADHRRTGTERRTKSPAACKRVRRCHTSQSGSCVQAAHYKYFCIQKCAKLGPATHTVSWIKHPKLQLYVVCYHIYVQLSSHRLPDWNHSFCTAAYKRKCSGAASEGMRAPSVSCTVAIQGNSSSL